MRLLYSYNHLRKKPFLLSLKLIIALFFVYATVVSPIIHNNDLLHPVHHLDHSPVCKWINDGKRTNDNLWDIFPQIEPLSYLHLFIPSFVINITPLFVIPFLLLFIIPFSAKRAPPLIETIFTYRIKNQPKKY